MAKKQTTTNDKLEKPILVNDVSLGIVKCTPNKKNGVLDNIVFTTDTDMTIKWTVKLKKVSTVKNGNVEITDEVEIEQPELNDVFELFPVVKTIYDNAIAKKNNSCYFKLFAFSRKSSQW